MKTLELGIETLGFESQLSSCIHFKPLASNVTGEYLGAYKVHSIFVCGNAEPTISSIISRHPCEFLPPFCLFVCFEKKKRRCKAWLRSKFWIKHLLHKQENKRMCVVLRTPRPICRSTSRPIYRSMLERYVGRDVGRHIGRGVSVEHRSICRPTYRPVCRPICRLIR